VLGDAPVARPAPPSRSGPDHGAGVALLIAALATLAPWTRFGPGSGWLHGAWAFDARWSLVAAIAALVGIVTWFVAGPLRPALARGAAIVAGALAALSSLMALLNPPPFTKPALAPWITLVASVAAIVLSLIARRSSLGPSD
jgi:hypothetical protein